MARALPGQLALAQLRIAIAQGSPPRLLVVVHLRERDGPAGAFVCALEALVEKRWLFSRDAGSGPIALRFELARAVNR